MIPVKPAVTACLAVPAITVRNIGQRLNEKQLVGGAIIVSCVVRMPLIIVLGAMLIGVVSPDSTFPQTNSPPARDALKMTQAQASSFAQLALKALQKEYPNKPEHVMNSATDILGPQALHPAFYGAFDWHSSVHGHWMLVRLLRLFPELPERQQVRALLEEHLTAKNVQAEADYFLPAEPPVVRADLRLGLVP